VAESRVNVQSVREVEVMPAPVAVAAVAITISDKTMVPAGDRVALRKICLKGHPVGVFSSASSEPVILQVTLSRSLGGAPGHGQLGDHFAAP